MYREALRVKEFRAILTGWLVSVLGDTSAYLAVTVLVYARTRSPLLSSLTFAVAFTPQLLGGTLLSGLVDRLRPKAVLVGFDVTAGLLVCLLLVPGVPIVGIYAVLFAIGTLAPLRSGTQQSVVSEVLHGETYVAGRSLLRIVSMSAQLVGLAAGGTLIATIGAREALVVDAASFGVSALVGLRWLRPRPARGGSGRLVGDSLRGIRDVWAAREPRRLIVLGWVLCGVSVAPEGLAAAAVAQTGRGPALVGVWMAVIPAGVIVADVLVVTVVGTRLRKRLVVPLGVASCLSLLAFLAAPSFPVALVLVALGGVFGAYMPGLDQLLRNRTPERIRARAFTVNSAGLMVVQGLGFAVAGALGEVVAPSTAIGILGAAGLVAALALARERHEATPRAAWPRAELTVREPQTVGVGPQSSQGP